MNHNPPKDRRAIDDFFTVVYGELKGRARLTLRNDAAATINPTALVNEAFLKMANVAEFGSMPPEMQKGIAARAMRQVLVEAARKRHANKREALMVPLSDDHGMRELSAEQTLIVDAALERLKDLNPRHSTIVEMRIFGGFDMSEISASLNVSKATVERDWAALRAWLAKELGSGR